MTKNKKPIKTDGLLEKTSAKAIVQVYQGENGESISKFGKKIGRPKKVTVAEVSEKLTKKDMREFFNAAFDTYAPQVFQVLFQMAQTDKDLLKFVVEQRIGKAAQVIAGDDQSPLTVIVKRGAGEPVD